MEDDHFRALGKPPEIWDSDIKSLAIEEGHMTEQNWQLMELRTEDTWKQLVDTYLHFEQ